MEDISLKNINRLAIPAIISGVSEPLISIADTAIVGQLGIIPLGAVGLATSFFSFMVWVIASFRHAISSIVSNHIGQHKVDIIATLLPQALILNILIGIFLSGVTSFFAQGIFELYNAKGALLDETVGYFQIRALGFPLIFAVMLIFGIFRGFQNTVWAMYITFFGTSLNILLDFVFVYGIDGFFPSYGTKGAAWASVISQGLMFILVVLFLTRKLGQYFQWDLRINPIMKRLMGMIGNLLIRTIALNLTFYFANRFANDYGNEYIACHTIFFNVWLFAAFFVDGYSNAGNAIGGKLYGAKNYDALFALGMKTLRIAMYITAAIMCLCLIGYTAIPDFFTNDDAVKDIFNNYFWVVIIFFPVNTTAFIMDGIYKGIGFTSLLRNTVMASTLIGFIPTVYLLDHLGFGLMGIWIGFAVWMFFRAGILGTHFYRNFKS